jgi:predicted regulator of Ras-like GTPase activity (Roadblock/LC7/MglB family)
MVLSYIIPFLWGEYRSRAFFTIKKPAYVGKNGMKNHYLAGHCGTFCKMLRPAGWIFTGIGKKDQHFNRKRTREILLLVVEKMLKPLLEEFLKVEGVSAAVVVGRDGFVIESAAAGKVDIEALGAMASTGLGTSEAMGNTLGKGELSQMLVELEKGPIILSPLSADELIAIVADTTSNVGRIRYELKKNKERIVAAL